MAKRERGVYEPSDEVRVFDGAEDEDDSEGSRLPLVIVLALVVLCAFAGVVWLAYTQGVSRGRTETPVLAAAPGPERVAPTNPGGAEVPYQGFKIYEQPAPLEEGDTEPAPPPAAAPAAKPAPPPFPVAQQPAPQPVPAPAAAKPAPPPAARPAAPAAASTPPPATRQAMTQPAFAPAATGAPRALPGPAQSAAPPAPATAKPAAPVASGGYVLQIGAFKSRAEADAAWRTYSARHGALLTGYGPNVQEADLGEKGTWYRLRIAGFADRDVAAALCERLKAQNGACFLGR